MMVVFDTMELLETKQCDPLHETADTGIATVTVILSFSWALATSPTTSLTLIVITAEFAVILLAVKIVCTSLITLALLLPGWLPVVEPAYAASDT